MKYVVGLTTSLPSTDLFNRYTKCKCIETKSENEAILKYCETAESNFYLPICLGFVNEYNSLIIRNFTSKYSNVVNLQVTNSGIMLYFISRLLCDPKDISAFSFYCPKYVSAASEKEALEIYNSQLPNSRYPAYCFGYLNKGNSFVVTNIFDYIS